jgi:hypothetical protein
MKISQMNWATIVQHWYIDIKQAILWPRHITIIQMLSYITSNFAAIFDTFRLLITKAK